MVDTKQFAEDVDIFIVILVTFEGKTWHPIDPIFYVSYNTYIC